MLKKWILYICAKADRLILLNRLIFTNYKDSNKNIAR